LNPNLLQGNNGNKNSDKKIKALKQNEPTVQTLQYIVLSFVFYVLLSGEIWEIYSFFQKEQ